MILFNELTKEILHNVLKGIGLGLFYIGVIIIAIVSGWSIVYGIICLVDKFND